MSDVPPYCDTPQPDVPPRPAAPETFYQLTEAIGFEEADSVAAGAPPDDYDTYAETDIGVGDCGDQVVENAADDSVDSTTVVAPAAGAAALAAPEPRTDEAVSAAPADIPDATDATERSGTAETRPQDVVRVKVVPTEHTQVNAPRIADAVADCQTVAFELAGGTPQERTHIENLANILHTHPDAQTRVAAATELDNCNARYIRATIDRLPRSVESIRLVDIDNQSPEFELAAQIGPAMEAWADAIKSPMVYNGDPGGGRGTGEQFIRIAARTSLEREPIMADQTKAIAADIAATTDATPEDPHLLGLVTGIVHLGTGAHIETSGFNVSIEPAKPINPYTGEPVSPVYGDLIGELIKAGDPNAPLDPIQIDRATIEQTFRIFQRNARTAAALARGMTDNEVKSTMNALDFMKGYSRLNGTARTTLFSTMATTLSDIETTVAERLRRQAGRA